MDIRERPILMSDPMVRATLRPVSPKSQIRRVLKPQPILWAENPFLGETWLWQRSQTHRIPIKPQNPRAPDVLEHCPYGRVGDRLWVREAWAVAPIAIHYRATNDFKSFPDEPRLNKYASTQGWRSPIHMPRWAVRLVLEITGIRVERVQDISIADCEREGITEAGTISWYDERLKAQRTFSGLRGGFALLWDSINAKRGYGWAVNPWVWVLEFRRVTP